MAIFTLQHGAVVGKDDTGTPIQIALSPGPGDFNVSGLEEGGVTAIAVQNRGRHLELVKGPDKEFSFSLTCLHDGKLTDNSVAKPLDLVLKTGTMASGVTIDPGGVVWTTDITFTGTRGGTTVTIVLSNCRVTADYAEAAEGNTISLSGTCYGGITIT